MKLSNADAAFRDEVRSFITDYYPVEMRVPNPETDLTKEQSLLWHRILYRKGWVAPLWPKEYGGPGWTITQRYIFEQETSRAGTLPPLPFGITMVDGGMGMTDELNVGHYLKRLIAINVQYGDPTFHVLRCAEHVFGSAREATSATSAA